MPLWGFGGNADKTRQRAVKRLGEERRRIKEEKRAEERRQSDIEHAKKKRALYTAQAEEREAYTRKKRATRVARGERFPFGRRLPAPPKVSKKTKRAVARGVTRKRAKESKIGWF